MNFSKKNHLHLNLIIVLSIFLITTLSCSSDEEIQVTQIENLSQLEIDNLKFLREEEKLARDVYLFSYDTYGDAIFNNISQSEQQHMDQVLTILNKYQIGDPASLERGVFTDSTIQTLYDDLTAQVNISLIEALKVGAFIEDLDINDLEQLKSITARTDILDLINMLQCGSRNHMRSYINQLELNNSEYIPQYITFDEFSEIINSPNERCGQ